MTIDELVKERQDKAASVLKDWQLAENYASASFRRVTDEDIVSGCDPLPGRPVVVEIEPAGITFPGSKATQVRLYCTVCEKPVWKVNLSNMRKTVLEAVHGAIIRGAESDEGDTMRFLIQDTIQAEVKSQPYECPHGHSIGFARLSDQVRQDLENAVTSLTRYRARVAALIEPLKVKYRRPEPDRRMLPEAAIREFQTRQGELKRLIDEGNSAVDHQCQALDRSDFVVDSKLDDLKNSPNVSIKSDAGLKLQYIRNEWQRKRTDLAARLWPGGAP